MFHRWATVVFDFHSTSSIKTVGLGGKHKLLFFSNITWLRDLWCVSRKIAYELLRCWSRKIRSPEPFLTFAILWALHRRGFVEIALLGSPSPLPVTAGVQLYETANSMHVPLASLFFIYRSSWNATENYCPPVNCAFVTRKRTSVLRTPVWGGLWAPRRLPFVGLPRLSSFLESLSEAEGLS